MDDKRLGDKVKVKTNLSDIGSVFAELVCEAYNHGWQQGFGSRSIALNEDIFEVKNTKERHNALVWLVKNGYLFCFEEVHTKIWLSPHYCRWYLCNRYGVTKKGWRVAHLYVEKMEDAA